MTTGGFDPNAGYQEYQQPQFGHAHATSGELLPRLGARIIDGLIVGIPTAIVSAVISFVLGWFIGGVIGAGVTAAAALGYFVFLETTKGQTFGKQILKLRVVGPDGGLPTPQQSLTRNAFYAVAVLGGLPIIGILFGLAGLVAAIVIAVTISSNPMRQGKHDEIAGGTRVVQL